MKRLIAGAVVAAGVLVALLVTCEGPVDDRPAAADVADAGAAEVPAANAVTARRARAATEGPTEEREVADTELETLREPTEAEPFVVVPVEVVDAETGRPIAGATVATGGIERLMRYPAGGLFEAVTDADGRAAAHAQPAAQSRADTSASGYVPSEDWVWTAPVGAEQPSLRVELAPGGTLRGVVRDPDGNPAEGATVYVRRHDVDDVLESKPSDSDGAYEVEGLAFGVSYKARTGSRSDLPTIVGSEPSAPLVPTKEHPVVVADLRLRRQGTLELTVLDGDDPIDISQLVKLSVMVRPEDGASQTRNGAPAGSHYLPPGRASVSVWFGDRDRVTEAVEIPEGETLKETVHLTRGAAIAGLVVDDAGAPVEDAWIRDGVPPRDAWEPRAVAQSQADGAFELTQLTAGDHELRVSCPFEYEDLVVRMAAPSENVRLVVQRRGVLKLQTVFDDDATPAADARIAFHGMLNGEPWDVGRTLPRDGSLEIAWPAGVSGDVGIAVDGFLPVTRSVTVAPFATVDLGEIRMRPACALSGVLHDEDGDPRPNVTLVARGLMGRQESKTGDGGRFSFSGLSAGALRLDLAEAPHASFQVDVPTIRDVVLETPRSGLFQVFASNASGQRLAGHRVEVRDADGVTVDSGKTDANGSWTSDLVPGRYSVVVENGPHGKAEVSADDVTVLRLR